MAQANGNSADNRNVMFDCNHLFMASYMPFLRLIPPYGVTRTERAHKHNYFAREVVVPFSLLFGERCTSCQIATYSMILHSPHKQNGKRTAYPACAAGNRTLWFSAVIQRAHDKLPISRPKRKCAFPSFQCHCHFRCDGNVLF